MKKKQKENKDKKEKKEKKRDKGDAKYPSPLPSDVLSEIRGFKKDGLGSTPDGVQPKKKVIGQSLLPADVLDELKKKADKKSD